jgi:glycosyltransferase involved in cell wall biosynthesis
MRIAILVAGLPPDRVGGAEVQAARAAKYLAARHHVTVLTRTATVPDDLARLPGCRVIQRCAVRTRGVRFAADLVQTRRLICGIQPPFDVLLAYQSVIDGLAAVLAARRARSPVVVSIRSELEFRRHRFARGPRLAPFVFRHADRLIVQSPGLADALLRELRGVRGLDPQTLRQKISVVPNGLAELPPAGSIIAEPESIVFLGQLTPVKGVQFLIEAMRSCPGERLLIVGDGPERASLERLAGGLSSVSFAGAVSPAEVHGILGRAKVLVLPSLHEGQPNAVLEAMQVGAPVIASRVGGLAELVKDGVTGFLVEPGDAAGIARHIRAIASDHALRARLGAAARKEVERYGAAAAFGLLEQELAAVARSSTRIQPLA